MTEKPRKRTLELQIEMDRFELQCFLEILREQEGKAWQTLADKINIVGQGIINR